MSRALRRVIMGGLDDLGGSGPPAVAAPRCGVCLIGGDRPLTRSATGDRLVVGKSWLIQRLGAAMRGGDLTVAAQAPGRELLRRELGPFVFKPGMSGRGRLEAARGHDDLVIATALAVLAAELAACRKSRPFAAPMRCQELHGVRVARTSKK